MIKLWSFIKGIAIQNESDRTKQLALEVDSAASSGTVTTLKSKQTLSRTLELPNVSGELVEKDAVQTLTNKTIDGDTNTVQDLALSSLKTELADANQFLVRDVSGQVISDKAVPVGDVVGTTDTQTLTNKTISGASNTIDNISAANVVVTPTGNLTSTDVQAALVELQGDIDTGAANNVVGPASATDNALPRFDGTTGKLVQNSGVIVSDTNNITGVNDLTVNGNTILQGDLTVNGTTTTINTATLDVEDQNITVNFNGTDVTGEGAGLTIDRTGTSGSLVYEDALPSKFKAGALGSEIQLANVSSTQSFTNKNLKSNTNLLTGAKANTFERETGNQQVVTIPDVSAPDTFLTQAHAQVVTNKDIDGGTASNTSRLTVPKNTYANLLSLTRKEGTILYATDTDKFYRDDGTSLQEIGSGSGTKNFITNGDAESGTLGWASYADAAASRPVDGTGGTATGIGFIATSTAPLEGLNSFLFSKDAANRQGSGFSYNFTIDSAYKAKVLNIEMDYILAGGTFSAGTSTTDSDLIVYMYDVTNSQLIEPSSFKLLSNSSTISDKFRASFQTSATGVSYRLIFHVATTSTSNFDLKIDNVKVSPSNYVYGSPITDWQSYTASGSFTTNTTYLGRWRRVGQNAEVEVRLTFAGAPNAIAGTAINLPSQAPIGSGQLALQIGTGRFEDIGNNRYMIQALASTTSAFTLRVLTAGGSFVTDADVTNTAPFSINNTDVLDIKVSYVVDGWSSSVQMSDQADTRVVAVSLTGSTSSVTSGGNLITPTTILRDTHGSFSGNTYTVRSAGFYQVDGFLRVNNAAYTAGQNVALFIRHNATDYLLGQERIQTSINANFATSGSFTVFANAGDTFSFVGVSDVTNTLSGALGFNASIVKVSGPQAIAANETVSLKYQNNAGTSIPSPNLVQVPYATKIYDTHNAWNGSVFTAPIGGKYRVTVATFYNSASWTVSTTASIALRKNGIITDFLSVFAKFASITTELGQNGSVTVDLNSGDTLDIRLQHNEGTARVLSTAATGLNWISIERVGN
jgi:hypothetical protein